MSLPNDIAIYSAPFALVTLIASLIQLRKNRQDLIKRQQEIDQRIYEAHIMREIGERIGYELNISKILDTITSSLSKLLPYSVVSYMLLNDDLETVSLRFHLEESVNRQFLNTVREHMLTTLNQIGARPFAQSDLRETVTGTIVDEESSAPVGSLWVTPLTINDRGIGVMAIASSTSGLYRGAEMGVLTQILAQANRAVNNLEFVIASEEKKLNAMVSSMADGIIMLDSNLNLLVINPAAASLLGLPVGSKLTIFDVVKALSDRLDLRSKLEESMKTDKLVTHDNLVVGNKVSQILISPVKDNNHQIIGSVVLFHDITAQRQLERIRQEFTAMMVHELRAPLTVVRGAADMFSQNPQLVNQEQGKKLLKTVENSTVNMIALVNDLLDVAKIEAGKFQILPTKNNLGSVVSESVNFFSNLAAGKSISIQSIIPDPNFEANFDRQRIAQVLNNLLSNAVKFSSVGGKITISVSKINTPTEIKWRFDNQRPNISDLKLPADLVSVSDSGTGIAEENMPELFSKFKQLRPSDKELQGTGLGLVIVKGIVESHGGQIFVESRVNEGTTVYFTIPIVTNEKNA